MAHSQIWFTTGKAGSGKSYVCCAVFLVDEFIPRNQGTHFSNFPIQIEGLKEVLAEKGRPDPAEDSKRIHVIPSDVLDTWLDGSSGPWDYFRTMPLANCHFALDEVHNFVGRNSKKKVRTAWQKWLGEVRHQGLTVEFISQSPMKVAKEISYEAAVRFELLSDLDARDPYFGCCLGDWYELRAKFITGEFRPSVRKTEFRESNLRWTKTHVSRFVFKPEYFKVYDSHNLPVGGGQKVEAPKREFQKRQHLGLILWFIGRNKWALASRLVLLLALGWFVSGGGASMLNGLMSAAAESVGPKPGTKKVETSQLKVAAEKPALNSVVFGPDLRRPGPGLEIKPLESKVESKSSLLKLYPLSHEKPVAAPAVVEVRAPSIPAVFEQKKEPEKKESALPPNAESVAVTLAGVGRGWACFSPGGVVDVGEVISPESGLVLEGVDIEKHIAVVSGVRLRVGGLLRSLDGVPVVATTIRRTNESTFSTLWPSGFPSNTQSGARDDVGSKHIVAPARANTGKTTSNSGH